MRRRIGPLVRQAQLAVLVGAPCPDFSLFRVAGYTHRRVVPTADLGHDRRLEGLNQGWGAYLSVREGNPQLSLVVGAHGVEVALLSDDGGVALPARQLRNDHTERAASWQGLRGGLLTFGVLTLDAELPPLV